MLKIKYSMVSTLLRHFLCSVKYPIILPLHNKVISHNAIILILRIKERIFFCRQALFTFKCVYRTVDYFYLTLKLFPVAPRLLGADTGVQFIVELKLTL